jgi:hypothetical protein
MRDRITNEIFRDEFGINFVNSCKGMDKIRILRRASELKF